MKKINSKRKILLTLSIIFIIIISILYIFFNKSYNNNYSEIKKAQNYKEMYSLIKSMNNNIFKDEMATNDMKTDSEKDYSDTNLQVLGVDEADIIKTDGNYIYALSYEKLHIIEANDGDLKLISSIKHHEVGDNSNSAFMEIYLKDDKLIAIKSINTYDYNGVIPEIDMAIDIFPWYGKSDTAAVIFDISNKEKPKKINELSQSGNYISSRMVNDNLYLVTNYYLYDNNFKSTEAENYIPYTEIEEKEIFPIDDIYIAPNPESSQYIVITGINVNEPDDFISKKSVFGSGTTIYSSIENLYIADSDSVEENGYYKSKTNILKFSLNDGNVKLDDTGSVNGSILNQFSMDEYNDTFRIVTTSNDYKISYDKNTAVSDWNEDSKNNLYVLDNDLNVIGSIENLAKGERVYSVRFDEKIVYFVTFKQVDPLFAVDLTDPKKPVIISKLKIPGFSEYLHVYNEKYLFGLGKETDKEGKVTGMKISMFDITDKKNIKEKYKLSLGDKCMWSEASYNHKAILVSTTRNLIAFQACNSYLIFSFDDETGFSKIGEIKFENDYWISNTRGLYIDKFFYIFNNYDLKSYNISSFKNIKSLKLEKYPERVYDIEG